MQDVVLAGERLRALERQNIEWLLDNAEQTLIAVAVSANAAGIVLADVVANAAQDRVALERHQAVGKLLELRFRIVQEVKHQALGRFRADAGQTFKTFHQLAHSARELGHYDMVQLGYRKCKFSGSGERR